MAKERGRARIGRHGVRAGANDASIKRRVEHLRRSFAKFRREHQSGTRIPQALRDEALAALQCGTPELDVRRACGITPVQLDRWRQNQCSRAQSYDLDGQKARVFAVVDELPGMSIERAAEDAAQNLELRIGGWAICIRKNEA